MIPLRDDNPTEINPIVTIVFMVACVLVFFWQVFSSPNLQQAIVHQLGVVPALLLGSTHYMAEAWVAPSVTVFTSLFLHGGWMHLIGNMLYLWIFGNNIEDVMGHGKFIVFYLLCGVLAVFAQALPDPDSVVPMVGASGAISGVLGAYLLVYPRAKVLIGIPIVIYLHTMRLPAMWVLGAWFLMQLVTPFLVDQGEGGVAFGAHIGGFIAGMVLIPFFKKPNVKLHIPFVK